MTTCKANFHEDRFSEKVSVEVAGSTCLGATPLGTQQGLAHSSMRPLHAWCASVRGMFPDLVIWECVANAVYQSTIKWWLEDKYHLEFIHHPGPVLFGHPMNRPRTYGIFVNKARFHFCGGQDDYFKTFGARLSGWLKSTRFQPA
eukprot:10546105-Lingulodinium_polyedra.AAC.1